MFGVRSTTRANLPSRYAFSLVSAPLPKAASASAPCASRRRISRSAMKSSATSQLTGASRPASVRIIGAVSRPGWSSRSPEVNPLMHICPRFTGKVGSGRTVMSGRSGDGESALVTVVTDMPH